jgi:DNA-binding transcriptional LysR family regulator
MILPVEFLKSFLAIADSGSFTKAALLIHRTQSAVSMQMRRLEEEIGKPLFARDGKSFTLTAAGETLVEHARRIVKNHDDTVAVFSKPNLYGKIRFGAAEDYASLVLPGVLSNFALSYPAIRVDVHVAPSTDLKASLDAGTLDMALCTEIKGNGKVVHREPVVWATSPHHMAHEQNPVPIAVYHEGCVFRKWATEALTHQKRAYRIAYVSTSVTGIIAAVKSGLSVAPLGKSYLPEKMKTLGPESGFPVLPTADILLHKSPAADSEPTACFEQHVVSSFSRLNMT